MTHYTVQRSSRSGAPPGDQVMKTQRSHHEQAAASGAPSSTADFRAQIKLWLTTIDALLVAIEETAFQVRNLGDTALTAVQGLPGFSSAGGTGNGKGSVSSLRALGNELSQ